MLSNTNKIHYELNSAVIRNLEFESPSSFDVLKKYKQN